jgi:hypothetical protein
MLPVGPIGIGLYVALAPLIMTTCCADGPWLRPITWTVFTFGIVLVIVPTFSVTFGFSAGVLPFLPSDAYLNIASLLQSLAFGAFAFATLRAPGRAVPLRVPHHLTVRVAVIFTLLGAAGLWLAFGTVATVIDYFRNPAAFLLQRDSDESQSPGALLANILRPFLIVGAVAWWSVWMHARGEAASRLERWGSACLMAVVIIFVGATFNLNRNSIVVPLVAFAATYAWTRGRLPILAALPVGGLGMVAVFLLGLLRGALAPDLVGMDALLTATDAVGTAQVYGGGAQYLGFLLESSAFEGSLFLGRTLWSSLLFPVPVIGKAWRESSGVTLYNQYIYGDTSVADQIIPFVGELFINFHVIGVVAGFYLLGRAVLLLDRSLAGAEDPLSRYLYMYLGVWCSFLILGSVASVSQILVYFCWPLYLLVGIHLLHGGLHRDAASLRSVP